jgi:HEAT repeat protein
VLRCSHDSNPAVRKYCARALEGNEHPAALTVLTGLLADDHFTVRFAAFESLKKTGSAVKPYLLAILYDQQTSPPYARDLAARLMEELK